MNILNITDLLPLSASSHYNKRTEPTTVIVIHHSASRSDVTPKEIAQYQIGPPDYFPGIAYHFVITVDGRIYQTNAIDTLSFHAGDGSDSPLNTNRMGVGVCLVGDFTHAPPPAAQLAATRELIAYLGLPFIPHKEAYNTFTSCPGNTWESWKGELKMEAQQMSIGSYQFQGSATSWARAQVKDSGVKMIKQLQPDSVDAWFSGDIIGRLWWNGEPDKQLVWLGLHGAEQWWNLAAPRISKCPNVKLWEGPNEVAIDTPAKAQLFNEFELRRIGVLHEHGLKAVSGCTSTGCWEPWVYPFLYDVFKTTDYWESHEYGMHSMTLDGYHLLRYRRVIAQLKAAGIRVPPWIIGETGIDYAGNPTEDGWQKWATPEEYIAQLTAYLKEVAKNPEVVLVTPFVWSDQGWPSFNHTEYVSKLYTDYIKGGTPVDTFLQEANKYVFPVNKDAALSKYILGRGWSLDSAELQIQGWVAEWAYDPVNNKRVLCRCQAPTWAVSEYATVAN